ncbi:tetratricopeptide repeat protein [Ancylostoma ceylanicum]|uniref:Tetratricopeptide repeat protein n=1 Tax=Ancylostoma ceylanicum TaxID=53326 RepID=A0A0D6LMY3_9BILA|nr:tetratricopeptide repeat protein [Ancylostoma ceylanicum]
MKSIVEADCGGPNALVGLAQNYGTSNQRIAPTVSRGVSSLLPSSSLGEQFANDFLQQKAAAAPAPSTFSMKALAAQLSKQSTSTTSLANNWSSEYAARPGHQLSTQWSQQYAASRPSFENAWAGATGQTTPYPAIAQSSTSVDSAMWSAEFLDNVETSLRSSPLSSELADSWAQEYTAGMPDLFTSMESEWDTIQRNIALSQKDEIQKAENDVYVHQEHNPFLTSADPLAEGDRLMQAGDLGNAMLAYEAAVQKNPRDAELARALRDYHDKLEEAVKRNPEDANAWCRLGLSHAENEHDSKAIAAFNNCLKIQPNNEDALLALSVSLANESVENEALHQLEKWIVAHQGGDPALVVKSPSSYSSFLDHETFEKVEERFLNAARQQSGTADAALQNALGVLYNLNRNYERAVECIKLAIASRPDDPRLWNRLGATLANGDRTPEAVAAYREALQRYPIEAVEHFVSALDLQKGGLDSSSIWPTLRSATIRMPNAPDEVLPALDRRDLNAFKAALSRMQPV